MARQPYEPLEHFRATQLAIESMLEHTAYALKIGLERRPAPRASQLEHSDGAGKLLCKGIKTRSMDQPWDIFWSQL
ncbi:hypothetical protein INS49_014399 [Diaporthe citri]|uniref:uncharacterized protein n=1 Tax=Diaporthe citri TaxID=83186 RepID=UPI001C809243|nr:uncharacterized protein INS49_014399 [Diaporthe citri]KAG6358515.1 hypothetical protein INS49_014399 [Diaporthe citri]